MDIKVAVVKRIDSLCREKNIKYNELAVRSGVTPSTVYSLMNPERHIVSVNTLNKICLGLGVSLSEFFSSDDFKSTYPDD